MFAVKKDSACFIIKVYTTSTATQQSDFMFDDVEVCLVKHHETLRSDDDEALSLCSCLCLELLTTSLDIHVDLLVCWFRKIFNVETIIKKRIL